MRYLDGDECVGVVGYWLFGGDMLFVEHIAISPQRRGGGIGGVVMEYLKEQGCEVILEIEQVVDDLTSARQRFYERVGFVINEYNHSQPPFREGDLWLPLVVMSYPQPLSAERYNQFRLAQLNVVTLADIETCSS
ncbi:MAG: GNAT family N-acetyltransferase [Rikenellaceae bacterium]